MAGNRSIFTFLTLFVTQMGQTHCQAPCPYPISPPHAFMNTSQIVFPEYSIVKFSCDEGYTPFGKDLIYCFEGFWSNLEFMCLLEITFDDLKHKSFSTDEVMVVDGNDSTCYLRSTIGEPIEFSIELLAESPVKLMRVKFGEDFRSEEVTISASTKTSAGYESRCEIDTDPQEDGHMQFFCKNILVKYVKLKMEVALDVITLPVCEIRLYTESGLSAPDVCPPSSSDRTNEIQTSLDNQCITIQGNSKMTKHEAKKACKKRGGKLPDFESLVNHRIFLSKLLNLFVKKNVNSSYWVEIAPADDTTDASTSISCLVNNKGSMLHRNCTDVSLGVCVLPPRTCGRQISYQYYHKALRSNKSFEFSFFHSYCSKFAECPTVFKDGEVHFNQKDPQIASIACFDGKVPFSSEPYRCFRNGTWSERPMCVNPPHTLRTSQEHTLRKAGFSSMRRWQTAVPISIGSLLCVVVMINFVFIFPWYTCYNSIRTYQNNRRAARMVRIRLPINDIQTFELK